MHLLSDSLLHASALFHPQSCSSLAPLELIVIQMTLQTWGLRDVLPSARFLLLKVPQSTATSAGNQLFHYMNLQCTVLIQTTTVGNACSFPSASAKKKGSKRTILLFFLCNMVHVYACMYTHAQTTEYIYHDCREQAES